MVRSFYVFRCRISGKFAGHGNKGEILDVIRLGYAFRPDVERIFITVRSAFIKQKSLRDLPPTGGRMERTGNEAGSFFLHVDIKAHIL
jgi:hypothetical protein